MKKNIFPILSIFLALLALSGCAIPSLIDAIKGFNSEDSKAAVELKIKLPLGEKSLSMGDFFKMPPNFDLKGKYSDIKNQPFVDPNLYYSPTSDRIIYSWPIDIIHTLNLTNSTGVDFIGVLPTSIDLNGDGITSDVTLHYLKTNKASIEAHIILKDAKYNSNIDEPTNGWTSENNHLKISPSQFDSIKAIISINGKDSTIDLKPEPSSDRVSIVAKANDFLKDWGGLFPVSANKIKIEKVIFELNDTPISGAVHKRTFKPPVAASLPSDVITNNTYKDYWMKFDVDLLFSFGDSSHDVGVIGKIDDTTPITLYDNSIDLNGLPIDIDSIGLKISTYTSFPFGLSLTINGENEPFDTGVKKHTINKKNLIEDYYIPTPMDRERTFDITIPKGSKNKIPYRIDIVSLKDENDVSADNVLLDNSAIFNFGIGIEIKARAEGSFSTTTTMKTTTTTSIP